ncbi:MAG: hypothetical protein ACC661_07105, partial [Verrucomicrobiales bacterium]
MAAGLVLAVGSASLADIQRPTATGNVPNAQPVTVRVIRGESVEISLQAATSSTKRVEFMLRSMPGHGVLGEIVIDPEKGDLASIVYTASVEKGVTEDLFTFAARHGGGRVSAAAEVRIEILEPVPLLDLPVEVDFGPVFLGDTGAALLVITNRGTGDYVRDLILPKPFFGPKRVVVPKGETVEVPLGFKPAAEKGFRHPLQLISEAQGVVFLDGSGKEPFTVDAGLGEISIDRETLDRIVVVEIVNGRSEEQTFRLSGDPRLRFLREVVIPGAGSFRVVVAIPQGDVGAFEGLLSVTDGRR